MNKQIHYPFNFLPNLKEKTSFILHVKVKLDNIIFINIVSYHYIGIDMMLLLPKLYFSDPLSHAATPMLRLPPETRLGDRCPHLDPLHPQ